MKYTKKELTKDLKQCLNNGFTVKQIAKWAFKIHLEKGRFYENSSIGEYLTTLFVMEEGEEYEYTIKELYQMVDDLNSNN